MLQAGVRFRTVVVDGRPHCEGRKLLRKLLHHGIPATYCLLNSLSYVIQVSHPPTISTHSLCTNLTYCSQYLPAALHVSVEGVNLKDEAVCCRDSGNFLSLQLHCAS